ncbi:FadR/GntR family transcriptional regulator [Luteipulveratus mongoliensis]|uniref:GntR family transcriptional regulator n=1 Tax=Luteipulveratus mongoliensis TaxID=571913 RepID=A0A0K1JR19_9MICO|nr:FCD domain-containing protein [Luteipulveratus mongoliensis]AKU19167.1 GntR family transcriptional regulator [Luteipulveratus mongoliensis]
MQRVRRNSLIEQVTAILRDEIADGRWAVGDRIPTEPELSDMTGAGRNTVREAVQSLVHAGLLERRQGSGTYVLALSEGSAALGQYLSAAQHRDVLELRLALDVSAAELAARRRTDEDVTQLRARLLQRHEARDSGDPTRTAEVDAALHRDVVVASKNAVFLEVYDSVLPTLTAAIADNLASLDARYDEEHEDLVEAIAAEDAARAGQSARCFLRSLLAEHDH